MSQLIKLTAPSKFQLGGSDNYEMIRAKNHTECHCVKKDRNKITINTNANVNKKSACKCPSNFIAEIDFEGSCNCICNQQTVDCYLRYEGKEGFTMSDQRLVHSSFIVLFSLVQIN